MGKLKIYTGASGGALKVVLYGPEGIGKSTMASRFPRPLFIDTEGGTRFLDVPRTKRPASWAELTDQVSCVWEDPSLCGTLVIDTADWAEQLCLSQICAEKKISSIEELGYGKGYVYLAEEFGRFLNTLSEITERGVTVVLTAHAMMRKFEQPDEMGAYDRWELKLQKKTAPLVKEWADLLLFANYKTYAVAVDKEGKKFKAQGGRRVLYTTHHPCWDAKNRLGLPEEMDMDWNALSPYLHLTADAAAPMPDPAPAPAPKPDPKQMPDPAQSKPPEDKPPAVSLDSPAGPVPAVLTPLLESAGVTEEEVREVIAKRQGTFPMGTTWQVMEDCGFVKGWVLKYWEQVVAMIRENPDRLPFTVGN